MSVARSALVFAVVLGVAVGPECGSALGQARSAFVNGNDKTALIRGEITAVAKVPGMGREATIKILHVYSGSNTLKGTTFVQGIIEQGTPALGALVAEPVVKVGEIGLWVMGRDQNTGDPIWDNWCWKAHTANYSRKIEWAETIEKLVKLKVEERFKSAKELCGHATPEVAQLGIEVVFDASESDAGRAEAAKFIRELPKHRAATRFALIRADRLLIDQTRKKWIASEERKALLTRLTDEPLTEEEGQEVVNHITSPWTQREFTIHEMAAPLGKIATNTKQPMAVRLGAIEKLSFAASRKNAVGDAVVFEIFVAVLKQDQEHAVRLEAAKACIRLATAPKVPAFASPTYSPLQQTTLRKLIADEKNSDVIKSLREALDKSK